MILVDSSVWVEVLRGRMRDAFAAAVRHQRVVTCLPVIQEVLQGVDNDAAFHLAAAAFADIPVLEDPITREVVDEAVALYRKARKAGVTIRSSVDCLIAACAQRNGATILHVDRDFSHLARVTALRVERL